MPKSRLSLLIEKQTIERAKRYSRAHKISILSLVNDFLSSLPVDGDTPNMDLTPTVKRLLGAAKGASLTDYRRHVETKYSTARAQLAVSRIWTRVQREGAKLDEAEIAEEIRATRQEKLKRK